MQPVLFAFLLALSPAATASSKSAAEKPAALPAGDGGEVRARMLDWHGPVPVSTLSAPVAFDRPGSPFGLRSDPLRGTPRLHRGLDLPGVSGTPVRASADGVVTRALRAGSYGNLVEIDHGDGVATRYAHLRQIVVASGVAVRRGDIVGLLGSTGRSTGPHLHFEVHVGGHAADPLALLSAPALSALLPARSVTPRWNGWAAGANDRLPTAKID